MHIRRYDNQRLVLQSVVENTCDVYCNMDRLFVFSGVISAETPSQVYERVKEIIEEHSQPVIWVASNDQL